VGAGADFRNNGDITRCNPGWVVGFCNTRIRSGCVGRSLVSGVVLCAVSGWFIFGSLDYSWYYIWEGLEKGFFLRKEKDFTFLMICHCHAVGGNISQIHSNNFYFQKQIQSFIIKTQAGKWWPTKTNSILQSDINYGFLVVHDWVIFEQTR
jgi:hypothetical protein